MKGKLPAIEDIDVQLSIAKLEGDDLMVKYFEFIKFVHDDNMSNNLIKCRANQEKLLLLYPYRKC